MAGSLIGLKVNVKTLYFTGAPGNPAGVIWSRKEYLWDYPVLLAAANY